MSSPLLPGSLLIAAPPMQDTHFEGTVVLLCAHEPDASVGLVLNRPLEVPLRTLLPEHGLKEAADLPLLWGGPVGTQQLILLHDSPLSAQEGQPVSRGIHFGGSLESARKLADAGGWLRFFLGYSGWSEGQLQEEMNQGAWMLLPCDPAEVWTLDWRWQWERLVARAAPDLAWLRQTEHPESN